MATILAQHEGQHVVYLLFSVPLPWPWPWPAVREYSGNSQLWRVEVVGFKYDLAFNDGHFLPRSRIQSHTRFHYRTPLGFNQATRPGLAGLVCCQWN